MTINAKKAIHITNGAASGGTVLHAVDVPPENLLVYWDELSGGPWVDFGDLGAWDQVRQDFVKSLAVEECYGSPDPNDDDGYDLLLDERKLGDAEIIYLWLGSGLADQLFLVLLVRFFTRVGLETRKLRVLQFQYVPGVDHEVKRLSLLSPETVRQHGHAEPLIASELDYLETVWSALVSQKPGLLARLVDGPGDPPLPVLNRGLRCLLGRYPDRSTGLNTLDTTLLETTCHEGPAAASIIGATLVRIWESFDDPSDFYLYTRLRRMGDASLNRKLVELGGTSPAMRDTEVRITETGLDVLNGKANAVEINGIDDWVCGVHLCSETNDVWYRDGDALTGSGF